MSSAVISALQVKALRDQTGAGMMDAKHALEATGGDVEHARDWLRSKGLARAGAKAARIAHEGIVELYVHHNHQLGALIELNCETDFVARSEAFRDLAHELAVQVAAAAPRYLRVEEIPSEVIERKREAFRQQALAQGKPAPVIEKIIDGKLREFYKRQVLVDQPWAKDDSTTVQAVVAEAVARFGENITIARFARFKVRDEAEVTEES